MHIEGDLAVTKCYPNPIHFSSVQRSKVEAEFSFGGGATTGNGGISLPDMGILVTAPNPKNGPISHHSCNIRARMVTRCS